MNGLVLWVVKFLLLALIAGIFAFTDNLFLTVGGSDSTSFLITPSLTIQLIAFLVCAAALMVPAQNARLVIQLAIAIVAALLGGHRLIVDNLHHQIRDVYLAVPVQVLHLDPANEAGLSVRPVFCGAVIGPADTTRSLRVVSPAVIGLDRTRLAALSR
jgi:hypothetical protein